ncbi:hypothetical protein Nepgr_015270 [Nepenthes gracilis]|uniref:Major facilitator superfamily (MFS) profile domain-containing protein n=1 Tax=Nepenthes gracilis TaxID=150966 RepID=A0AAD3SMJ7_NEPGR|nr:hypothetical protein Nepgr_015270 [Nepenthes gracilis]
MAGGKGEEKGMSDLADKRIADFEPFKKPKRNKYALVCATLASMTSILLGYDIGVMSGASLYIKKQMKLSDLKVGLLNGCLSIYCLLGSAAAGRTSDWIGRRYTIVVAGAIFFAGALLMGCSSNYPFLMIGRFVAGIGVGYALMIAPVYTAEVSPASTRGFLTSFPEIFINVGILLGYVSNYGFSKLPLNLGWRFMLGIGAIPSVFLAFVVLAMPESPRWLVMQGRLGAAKLVLDKTSDSKEESELRLSDIKDAAGIPQDCNDDVVPVQRANRSHGEGVWKDLFIRPSPAVRRILIAGIGIHFFQQSSGIDAVVLYSPRIFQKAGINSVNLRLLATVAVGFVKTMFILVATFFLDRVGRRPLLLSSVGGMIFSLAALGTALTIIDHFHHQEWAVVLSLLMVLSYVAFFSIGMGPITWVYSSEIFPLRLRAQGCSIAVAVNRVVSGVISITFLSLSDAITTGGAFYLFAAIALVAWVFFYTFLPETRGRTLEQMDGLFGDFSWRESLHKKSSNNCTKQEADSNGKSNSDGQIQLGSTGSANG